MDHSHKVDPQGEAPVVFLLLEAESHKHKQKELNDLNICKEMQCSASVLLITVDSFIPIAL